MVSIGSMQPFLIGLKTQYLSFLDFSYVMLKEDTLFFAFVMLRYALNAHARHESCKSNSSRKRY